MPVRLLIRDVVVDYSERSLSWALPGWESVKAVAGVLGHADETEAYGPTRIYIATRTSAETQCAPPRTRGRVRRCPWPTFGFTKDKHTEFYRRTHDAEAERLRGEWMKSEGKYGRHTDK